MPWNHCDTEILDDESCPDCGLTKDQWTLEVDTTRTFQVSAKRRRKAADAWIELIVQDEDGGRVAGRAYRLELPDGRIKEGSVGDDGTVRLERLPHGACRLTLP